MKINNIKITYEMKKQIRKYRVEHNITRLPFHDCSESFNVECIVRVRAGETKWSYESYRAYICRDCGKVTNIVKLYK